MRESGPESIFQLFWLARNYDISRLLDTLLIPLQSGVSVIGEDERYTTVAWYNRVTILERRGLVSYLSLDLVNLISVKAISRNKISAVY